MSSLQPSSALAKRSASSALMPPPPAPKRIKRPTIVLDEDTYTSAIAHIIRRDFFPGLEETDAQREYLNALESKNNSWIKEAGKRLTYIMTPLPGGRQRKTPVMNDGGTRSMTPMGRGTSETPRVWSSDTPLSVIGTDTTEDGEPKKPDVDLSLSLGAFQAKYTSEDTESFSQIIDLQNLKRFEKSAWMRDGNRYASKQRLAQQKLMAANPQNATTSTALALRPSEDLDDRPAAPTMHKHTAFNSIMFAPDSVEEWTQTRAQRNETASLAPPKAVLYHNTRLPDPSTIPARPASPTLSAVRDAVAGHPRLSASEGGYTGSETPRVNGYAFVEAQAPKSDEDEEAPTDLLERFGARPSLATPFTIHESQRRERLHHKMVDRIAEKKSGRDTIAGGGLVMANMNQTPKFLSAPIPRQKMAPGVAGASGMGKKVGNLTPAAQRLFESVGGSTPRNAGSGGFGGTSGSGREWTPTPKTKRRA